MQDISNVLARTVLIIFICLVSADAQSTVVKTAYLISTYATPFCLPTSIYVNGSAIVVDYSDMTVQYIQKGTATHTAIIGTSATPSDGVSYDGDGGLGTSALLHKPYGITVDPSQTAYISDSDSNRIRTYSAATNIISTIAGTGLYGYAGDGGAATSANLAHPTGIYAGQNNNIFIADTDNHRIRVVNYISKVISTLAGSASAPSFGSFSGDNGPATSATLNSPRGVFANTAGRIYIADTYNHRIRRISSTGIISTIAGTSSNGYNGNGLLSTSTNLNFPYAITGDTAGNLYIADRDNQLIRVLTFDTHQIFTIAGTPSTPGYTGDGLLGYQATLTYPEGVFIDASGFLYAVDSGNKAIRLLSAISTNAPTVSPSSKPSSSPTALPSAQPTSSPTSAPTSSPTSKPSVIPTAYPTVTPSSNPTVPPTVLPSAVPSIVPSQGASVNPTAVPTTPAPSANPTITPTSIYWILSYTADSCFTTCTRVGGSCVRAFFKTVTSFDTFGAVFNQSVFAGTCRKLGATVNTLGQYNYTATPQSYCNAGIYGVSNSFQNAAAYTQQSILSNNVYTYTTKCYYPTAVAYATAGCLTAYGSTNAPATANAPSQQFCPCSTPCK